MENIWRRKIYFAEEKKIGGGKYMEKEKLLPPNVQTREEML